MTVSHLTSPTSERRLNMEPDREEVDLNNQLLRESGSQSNREWNNEADLGGESDSRAAAAEIAEIAEIADYEGNTAHQDIAMLAYSLWEEGGRRDDSTVENWLEAERRIGTRL